jgi:hypothetical protein
MAAADGLSLEFERFKPRMYVFTYIGTSCRDHYPSASALPMAPT